MNSWLVFFITAFISILDGAQASYSVRVYQNQESFEVYSKFIVHDFSPSKMACGDKLSKVALSPLVMAALLKSNAAFKLERHWPDDLVDSRIPIAEKYRHRSYYRVLAEHHSENVVGSIGLTEARYSRDHMPDLTKSPEENEAAGFEILPKEKTLGYMLPRPLDSTGKGVIFELRTYFVDGEFSSDVRGPLLNLMLKMIDERLADYPELATAKIMHTYNDLEGIRLYPRFFGFGFDPETPKKSQGLLKLGIKWWGLAASKTEIEDAYIKTFEKSKEVRIIAGNRPLTLPLPGGRKVKIQPGSQYYKKDPEHVSFVPHEDFVIDEKITAAAGNEVHLSGHNALFIERVLHDTVINGIPVPHGAGLVMTAARDQIRVFEDFRIEKTPEGKSVQNWERLQYVHQYIRQIVEPAKVLRENILIPKNSWIEVKENEFSQDRSLYFAYPAQEMQLAPGIWAAQGSAIEFGDVYSRGRYSERQRTIVVYSLARPVEIFPGIVIKAGEHLSFFLMPGGQAVIEGFRVPESGFQFKGKASQPRIWVTRSHPAGGFQASIEIINGSRIKRRINEEGEAISSLETPQ